jgi:hypothetical protein
LFIDFATAITILWYLESIGEAFHFCCESLCLVDFSIVMNNDYQILKHSPADEPNLSVLSPLRKALPNFAPQVVFPLHLDMTVTAVNSAIEELWPLRVIQCALVIAGDHFLIAFCSTDKDSKLPDSSSSFRSTACRISRGLMQSTIHRRTTSKTAGLTKEERR